MAGADDKSKEAMQLTIRDQNGDHVQFRVRKSTKFSKIFKAYGKKKGLKTDSMKFQYDGETLLGDKTPADHGIEDGEQIDVTVSQDGGTW